MSYRFVVSLATLRAAGSVVQAVTQKKQRRWQRIVAFFVRDTLRFIIGLLIIALFGWIAVQAALAVARTWGTTQGFGSGTLLPIATFLVVFLAPVAGLHIAVRRWAKMPLQRLYWEFYSDNEFLLEGRQSHLWFEEQSAGAIRRWATFEQLVEFEEGLWLFLRRRTTFAGQRGILISKESLPGSCPWSELTAYLRERIEGAQRSSSRVT